MQKHVTQSHHDPVPSGGELDLVDLLALVARCHEVFGPILDPLHWAPEMTRQERDHYLLRVEEHDLRPEPATGIGGHHPKPVRRHREQLGQVRPNGRGRLRTVEDDERVECRVVAGHHATRLERHAGAPLDRHFAAHDDVHVREGQLRIADALGPNGPAVAGQIGVNEGTARARCLFEIGHCRKRLELELHKLEGVLGDIAVLSHDHRDGLPHEMDLVHGERARRLHGERRVRAQGWEGAGDRPQIRGGKDTFHAYDLERSRLVD